MQQNVQTVGSNGTVVADLVRDNMLLNCQLKILSLLYRASFQHME